MLHGNVLNRIEDRYRRKLIVFCGVKDNTSWVPLLVCLYIYHYNLVDAQPQRIPKHYKPLVKFIIFFFFDDDEPLITRNFREEPVGEQNY